MPNNKAKDAAKLRKARGTMSQKDAALIVGVSTRHYQRLEAGELVIRAAYVSAVEHAPKKA